MARFKYGFSKFSNYVKIHTKPGKDDTFCCTVYQILPILDNVRLYFHCQLYVDSSLSNQNQWNHEWALHFVTSINATLMALEIFNCISTLTSMMNGVHRGNTLPGVFPAGWLWPYSFSFTKEGYWDASESEFCYLRQSWIYSV